MTRALIAAAYIATIWLANLAVQHFGVVPVGFGLEAPAGVFFAGIALTLRDLLQEKWGRVPVVVAIIVGAATSYLIAPAFAVASGVAFLVSELADFAVYTPLRDRTWLGAVVVSNTVGTFIDSYLFLTISGLGLAFFWGQVVGKTWVTLLFVLLVAMRRRAVLARHTS